MCSANRNDNVALAGAVGAAFRGIHFALEDGVDLGLGVLAGDEIGLW